MSAVSRCKQCIQQTQQKSQPRKNQKTVSPHVHIPTQQLQHTHHAIYLENGDHILSQEGVTQGGYNAAMTMYALST